MKQAEKHPNEIAGTEQEQKQVMSRKKAIKKVGYVALSAATMMLLLSKPDKAVAAS